MPTRSQWKAAQVAINQVPTVDGIVSNITRYVNICEEQSAYFRRHTAEFTHEYDLYLQAVAVAQPSQNWKPAPGDRDAYVAEMESRCRVVPQTMADHVKIYCAAHAILACTVFVDMDRHDRKARLEILAKSSRKCQDDLMARSSSPQFRRPVVELLTKSTRFPPTRRLTENDRALFERDPTSFVNKQFILETGDGILYELVEVRFRKDSWEYYVRFEGCFDSTAVDAREMMIMLSTSSLVDV